MNADSLTSGHDEAGTPSAVHSGRQGVSAPRGEGSAEALTSVPVLEAWLRLCCETSEFVAAYNRLRGTRLRFTLPPRSNIEQMVDRATGHVPTLNNDETDLQEFFEHCRDLLLRMPMLYDSKNFRQADHQPKEQ